MENLSFSLTCLHFIVTVKKKEKQESTPHLCLYMFVCVCVFTGVCQCVHIQQVLYMLVHDTYLEAGSTGLGE